MIVPRTFVLMFTVFSVMLSGLRCTTAPAAPGLGDRDSLMRGRTWITESITFDGTNVTSEGVRTLRLNADGTYRSELNGGSSLAGTWALSPDGSKLVLDGGAMEESVFDLLDVTSERLRMSWTGEREERSGLYEYTGRAA